MKTETTTLEIGADDRRVLMSALCALDREHLNTDFSGDHEIIERLRQQLSVRIPEMPHPVHVELQQAEFRSLMSVLPTSESWRLSLNRDDERYALAAEVTSGAAVWEFELARGLKGAGRFLELAEEDQHFFRQVEESIRAEAPSAAQIIHEAVEIPLPWDFMPDDETHTRVEEYLNSLAVPPEYAPAIHATYLDEHSDERLDMLGYASVMTEISGFEDEIEAARSFIARVIESIKATPAMSR